MVRQIEAPNRKHTRGASTAITLVMVACITVLASGVDAHWTRPEDVIGRISDRFQPVGSIRDIRDVDPLARKSLAVDVRPSDR